MSTGPKPLIYHDSVDAFRRELMERHAAMYAVSQNYREPALSGRGAPPEAATDALHAATMAWNMAYAFAAVLGVAAREFGDDVAHRLAFVADDLMVNGDADPGHNADLTPGKGSAG